MKLLYVWIEKFRNIRQQGFSVDNEYIISFNMPTGRSYEYLNSAGQFVSGVIQPNISYRKVYYRDFMFMMNPSYRKSSGSPIIQSITALVGENASGKTSIMECIYRRADQFDIRNVDQRYYCLVFLDEDRHCLIIRSKDVWLSNPEFTKIDLQQSRGYDEYIIPLSPAPTFKMSMNQETSVIVSVYQDYKENTEWCYQSLGVTTYPINLSKRTIRNAFLDIFDFICAFPTLGGEDNSLAFYLNDNNKRSKNDYFTKAGTTPEEYKQYFILKLAQLLFAKLGKFLYHPEPQFSMDGHRINQLDESQLEDGLSLTEKVSFLNRHYPNPDGISIIKEQIVEIPKDKIAEVIEFLKQIKFVYSGKSVYDDYLNCIEQLFISLYSIDSKYFTGFYRLRIPFNVDLRNVVQCMSQCLNTDLLNGNWTEDIAIGLEWLSAGDYQRALLFSGLYEVFNSKMNKDRHKNLIMLLDEPEVHMHPEAGRQFIGILAETLSQFQNCGLINQCQLILATHSPFIVQQLKDYNSSIELVEKKDGVIIWENFNNKNQLLITTPNHYSFNLVMYYIFGVPTVELHIELYGYIQRRKGCDSIRKCDDYIANHTLYNPNVHLKPDSYNNGSYKTLPTYIRNAIDHPDSGRQYTDQELRASIELLIGICKQLK